MAQVMVVEGRWNSAHHYYEIAELLAPDQIHVIKGKLRVCQATLKKDGEKMYSEKLLRKVEDLMS